MENDVVYSIQNKSYNNTSARGIFFSLVVYSIQNKSYNNGGVVRVGLLWLFTPYKIRVTTIYLYLVLFGAVLFTPYKIRVTTMGVL